LRRCAPLPRARASRGAVQRVWARHGGNSLTSTAIRLALTIAAPRGHRSSVMARRSRRRPWCTRIIVVPSASRVWSDTLPTVGTCTVSDASAVAGKCRPVGYRFVHVQLTPAPRVATLHSGQNRSAGARFPAEIRQGDDQIARAKCAGPHFLRINMTKQTPLLGTAAPSSGSSEGQTVGLQTQKQHSTRTWAPTINHRLTFAAFGRLEKETFKGDD
jgi:hypothetical protein